MRILKFLTLPLLLAPICNAEIIQESSLPKSQWTQIYDGSRVPGPQAREHLGLWQDPKGAIHVYSGLAYRPRQWLPIFDHWVLNEGQWTERQQKPFATGYYFYPSETADAVLVPSDQPSSGTVASAPIPDRDEVLIYRSAGTIPVGETDYQFQIDQHPLVKFSTQSAISETLAIGSIDNTPLTQLGNFVYDPIEDQYLLFCGLSLTAVESCNDVYRFKFTNEEKTEGTWTLLKNASDVFPPSRYGAAAVYDQKSQRIVLIGGGSSSCTDNPVCPREDAWTMKVQGDEYTWTELKANNPKAGRNACWAYDSKANRMLMLGQTPNAADNVEGLHILDLTSGSENWQTIELPEPVKIRSSCRAIYDEKMNRFIFGFGNSSKGVYTDLWSLDLNIELQPEEVQDSAKQSK